VASTDAQAFPVKGKALRLTFPVFTSAGALVTSGTQAVTISKDAGTFANPNAGATNATQIASSSGVWYVDLNSTDLTCDTLAVKISDGTNPPVILVVYPVTFDDPAGAPGWGSGGMSLPQAISWLVAHFRNRREQTDSTSTLFKDDGTTTASTSAVTTPSAGTERFGEWT